MSSLDKGLLEIVLPRVEDFYRMKDKECREVVSFESYTEFVTWNIECLKLSSEEELKFFRFLCNKIMRGEISQMDFEDCSVWKTSNLFFDMNRNHVVVHPR
jgi:hypothetical protein